MAGCGRTGVVAGTRELKLKDEGVARMEAYLWNADAEH